MTFPTAISASSRRTRRARAQRPTAQPVTWLIRALAKARQSAVSSAPAQELAAGLGALLIPGIGPVVAAGWLIPTIIGAAVGASGGGIVGALIGAGVSEEHAHVYAETVRRGGAVVTVRVDDDQIPVIEFIMARRAVNPEQKATLYRSTGWTRFDADAPPYVAKERTVERTTVRQTPPAN